MIEDILNKYLKEQDDKDIDKMVSKFNKESKIKIHFDGAQKDIKGNIIYHQFTTRSKNKKLDGITFAIKHPCYKEIKKHFNISIQKFLK